MGFDFTTRSWRIRVGYRAGSEEVVDGVIGASSVYVAHVASIFFYLLNLAVAVAI
jgi:hypothetical protein